MEKIKTSYKVIFAIIIATIFLALSLGLYAILNHKGGMGASINFTATGVSGTITGEVKAYNSTKFNSQLTPAYDTTLIEQSTYSAAFSPRTYSMADWNVGLIRFLPNDINYTGIVGLDLTITNTGTKPILLTFPSPTLTATNVAIQYVCNSKTIQFAGLGIDNFSIASGEELDISLQLYIPDRKAFASSTNIQININLVQDTTTVSTPVNTFPDIVVQSKSAIPQKVIANQDYSMFLSMPIGNVLTDISATCGGNALTTSFDYNTNILTIGNSNNEITGAITLTTSTIGLAGGTGTEENPLKISSAENLTTFAELVNSGNAKYSKLSYELTQPVDLNGIEYQAIGSDSCPFEGVFDGNSKPISNLTINKPTQSYQGLFGYAKNAIIDSVLVASGDVSGKSNVGGIVGYANNTTVKNSINYSEIQATGYCGGIVGHTPTSSSLISFCTNYGNISGDGSGSSPSVGGICGDNSGHIIACVNNAQLLSLVTTADGWGKSIGGVTGHNRGTIDQCQNNGNISTEGYTAGEIFIGGVCGMNSGYREGGGLCGTIKDCFNTGNLVGVKRVGGVVGVNNYGAHQGVSSVYNSYSIGIITAIEMELEADYTPAYGCAIGNISPASYISSCYGLPCEDAPNALGAAANPKATVINVIALTPAQMQLKESFVGWDFENVWTFDKSSDYKYPVLRCFL